MRWLCLVFALLVSMPLASQEKAKAKKKPAATKPAVAQQKAHSKPTPEQIRKFNELQKKKQ